MTFSPADIKLIVEALQTSEWSQAEIVMGDVRIAVGEGSDRIPPAAPVAAPESGPEVRALDRIDSQVKAAAPAATDAAEEHVVTSPSVGVFRRASTPGEKPFVEVGQEVAAGATVGLVEVSTLTEKVTTEVGGVVTAVHVEDAQGVEFGTPLVSVSPRS